ncbi:MAG: NAD(P)H-hydrate epimerase, partial [Methanosarcinales archaeon]|nr:NAD(P)H-hydrate epimerase [Methanosarcinales archaeon]
NCEYLGIQKVQLMESAGASVAQEIKGHYRKQQKEITHSPDDAKYNIVMFAGTGNNGGDAFVAARHLAVLNAFSVSVVLLGHDRDIKTDEARSNFRVQDTDSITVFKITDSSMLASLSDVIQSADCIVDAMLGTGIKGKVREPASTAIDIINGSSAFKIAVDVPSGCDGDTGRYDKTVFADTTITFHRMKPGIKDAKCAGTVKVVPIGIPDSAFRYVGLGDLMMMGARNPMSHKGQSGRVLIIGGGAYTGAPALAALGALRTGADIVTVAAPASVSRGVQAMSANIIVRSLSGDRLCDDDIPLLEPLIKEHDCVVIGMGLGKGCDSVVSKVVGMCDRVVIDADAITGEVIASLQDPKCGADAIITPHVGEFKRLADLSKELESRCIDVSGLCAQG